MDSLISSQPQSFSLSCCLSCFSPLLDKWFSVIGKLFPRALEVKLSELLSKLNWFLNDPLHLITIPHFIVTSQREIFTLWVTFETIVCENTTQVRVVTEEHSIHIPDLTFGPVRGIEEWRHRVDGCQFVGVSFDTT